MLIDTHCHLHDRSFFSKTQAEKMVQRARENKVQRIVCIGTSHENSLAAKEFADTHDDVYWTYGIHPSETNNLDRTKKPLPEINNDWLDESFKESLALELKQSPALVAIGEVGLDYHYDGYSREAQIRLFEQMLQLAQDNNLPISFHVREAFDDFFSVVANFSKINGVIHSFSDNKKVLKRILNETEFYIGVNGMATYSTLPTPPLSRILLETDAPFLTPRPFRGIINEPAYIPAIADWLAEKLGENLTTIESETTRNAERLFKFQNTNHPKARAL